MMHAIASSSQVSLIKKSRIFVFPPRLSLPSLSQRKTVSCASLPAENLPSLSVSKISEENPLSSLLAEKLPSLSVSKISEDNPLPSKQVDWLSLTDEEFEEAIEAISSEFGPDCSKMNAEEFSKFCKRRGKHVDTCSRRLSELVGNVDLMTPWKRWRNRDFSFLACNDDEFKQLELPAVKEYHDPALKSRASKDYQ
ncbi:hypothetical protein L7F22_007747 [Adiantum nelumboides]|nr:hypothetical protein [Adiantum nelumboides]